MTTFFMTLCQLHLNNDKAPKKNIKLSVILMNVLSKHHNVISKSCPCMHIYIIGLTNPTSTFSSDMSTTILKTLSTINSDMPTTVSEVPPPQVNTPSAGLSQEIVITIAISSSILALGVLILLIVLVVKQCRQKNRQTPAKNKGNCFATKQGNFSKKGALKPSIKPRKSKFSGKKNTKQESISLDKFEHTQFNNSQAPKDRMYEHYYKTPDYMYWNNSGNQHVFNHSHTERNMIKYGNQHDRYPKSLSGPNNRMLYQSCYPEHPSHNEGMFQYYRADKLYREQQMYQMPYVAQYDDYIKIKPENKRFEERTYERNWDFLY